MDHLAEADVGAAEKPHVVETIRGAHHGIAQPAAGGLCAQRNTIEGHWHRSDREDGGRALHSGRCRQQGRCNQAHSHPTALLRWLVHAHHAGKGMNRHAFLLAGHVIADHASIERCAP